MARFFDNTFYYEEPEDEIKIDNIYDFFREAQKRTGQFCSVEELEDGNTIYKPYKLFEKQVEWLNLFDKNIRKKRRALLASRDKGKSQIISILGSAWAIYQDPKRKIAIMSFKYDNASKIVHNILQILESFNIKITSRNGGYYTETNKDHTPSIMPMGLLSTVRMMHFDDLIMDDPLTVKEQFSKKLIERARYFINEGSSISRRVILIGQLLTRHDLYYEAFANVNNNYFLMQSWHGDIPELDKDIEALIETDGIKDVARNYLGRIEDAEDAIFSQIIIEKSQAPANADYFAYIDPSFEGQDYTAVAIGWWQEGRIIVYGEIFKKDWGACLDEIINLVSGCYFVYYEKNGGVAPLGRAIKSRTKARVFGISSTGNKIAKIYSIRPFISLDKIRLHENTPSNAKKMVLDWTETAEHDDMPDALTMLCLKMLSGERKYA